MFVHKNPTRFSVVVPTASAEIVKSAASDQQGALCITVQPVWRSRAVLECRLWGVKPLIRWTCGSSAQGRQRAPPRRLLLLVQNHQGYLNLWAACLDRAIQNQAVIKSWRGCRSWVAG
jgi:DNA polymerase III alpha subunit